VDGRVTRLAAMPRLVGFAVALVLAAQVAGCGDDGGGPEIPQEDADALIATTQEIEQASDAAECEDAQAATNQLRDQVDALEGEVDSEIFDALSQMVSRLDEELGVECVEEGTTDTEETVEEPVEPVEPEPTTTTTTTEPPPEEEEEPEEEEAPPEQPSGEGGGPEGPAPPVEPPGQSGGAPPTGGIEEEGD
jgi:outer membrane biosynthesis protein TonB